MEKLEKLTPEQELKMIEVKDYWLNYINSCKNSINREKAKIGIDWLYSSIGKESPIIIYLDSPMGCQIGVNYLKNWLKDIDLSQVKSQVWSQVESQVESQVRSQVESQVLSQVRSQVESQVESQVWSQVESQVESQVWSQVGSQVKSQVWSQVRSQVGSQVGSQVWSQVWSQVGSQVGSQVRSQVWSQVESQVESQVRSQVKSQVWSQVESEKKLTFESFCSYGSISDYGWVSFYDFFTQIGVINNEGFNKFKEIISSGIYDMIQLDGFCIVSELPKELKRNELNDLHSLDSPAITFKDGYCQYFINGRAISETYFNSISNKTFTIEDFINESNEEYKSTCIAFMQEKHGEEYIINFFRQNLKEVDTYVDKKDAKLLIGTTGGMNVGVYTLFKGEINDEDIAYVRCFCPSTDRMFFLGVDSIHNNAKDAIASLYRIPSKLKAHIKSISRQGERFSTILTEKGKEILKSMSEAEISDNSTLNGSDYFSKIKHEY